MKPLFFLYVWLNLTEDSVKHIKKRTIQTGRLFFSSSLNCQLFILNSQFGEDIKLGFLLIKKIQQTNSWMSKIKLE